MPLYFPPWLAHFFGGMNRFSILLLAVLIFVARLTIAGAAPSAAVFEGKALCFRVAQLTESFAGQFRQLQPTNKIAGNILDLRFADGDAAAVEAVVKILSVQKKPLVILVNSQTRGGAAELAVQLREDKLGVIIGSTNLAGRITPDIAVAVSAEDEKQFMANPFAATTTNGAPAVPKNELLSFVDHMTEAELVRKRIKDGEDPGDEEVTPRPAPPQPVILDPALARAVDLVKALAVLKHSRD